MTEYGADLWQRARRALQTARLAFREGDCDAAASRSYYAAFYAVSALFDAEGMHFRKHSGVERAVHRDLVHSGRWPVALGSDYHALRELRDTGDYGVQEHVEVDQAQEAIQAAARILDAVRKELPQLDAPT